MVSEYFLSRRLVRRWFARAVIFSFPAALVVLWLYGNVLFWRDPHRWDDHYLPYPGWLTASSLLLDVFATIFLLLLFIFSLTRFIPWLWRNAELTRRPDHRA